MYGKAAASAQRSQFFTVLGQYLSPIPSMSGERPQWINYRTGIKDVYIRMEILERTCRIGFVISHPDEHNRLAFFDGFVLLRPIWDEICGRDWIWEADSLQPDGQPCARISRSLGAVTVMNKADWPEMISFFKDNLIKLDAFWFSVKERFY